MAIEGICQLLRDVLEHQKLFLYILLKKQYINEVLQDRLKKRERVANMPTYTGVDTGAQLR